MSDKMHTPGPWKVAAASLDVWEDGGYTICEVYPPSANSPEKVANARLIAAAPELLEALEMLMPQYPSRGMCDEYDRAMWENAEAAIAKATGKSPS